MAEVEVMEAMAPSVAVNSLQTRQNLECRRTWSGLVPLSLSFDHPLPLLVPPQLLLLPQLPLLLQPRLDLLPLPPLFLYLGLQDFTPMLQCEAKVRKKANTDE